MVGSLPGSFLAIFSFQCYNVTEYEDNKMKKISYMLMSILLFVGSFMLINRLQIKNFTVFNNISSEQIESVKEHRIRVKDLGFTALLCNEMRVPFDDSTNTFFVPLDMNTEQWETMKFESGQSEFQILFNEDITDEKKSDVIAKNKKVELFVYSEDKCAEYYVTFTGLPIVDLSTNEGFYAAENITGSAVFFDTDFLMHGTQQSAYNGHIRGNTSRMFPKKGYKINLRKTAADGTIELNKLSLFGMRKDDDWILHALYNDDTKIRDMFSMKVWDSFGAQSVSEKSYYGPRMTYVEVFADNTYCGLYGLMEPVDAKQLDLAEEDYAYKKSNPGGLRYQYPDLYDVKDPNAEIEGFRIKEGPVDEDADLWNPLANLSAVVTLEGEEFLQEDTKLINEESALKLWLFIQLITGHDHTGKNVFYVAKYDNDLPEDYQFFFAPWDMDLTWGNVSVGEINPVYTEFQPEIVEDRVLWVVGDKLLDENRNNAQEYVQNLYKQLRATVLTDENVEEMIYELNSQLRNSGAFVRDKYRWPDGVHASNCESLVDYTKERLEFLDKALYDIEYYDTY